MSGSADHRHLDALTGIRGIAAWAVVLYHCRLSLATILPQSVISVLGKGYLAVDLFFILSGFVIWYNYADRLADGGRAAVGDFLWRRFGRVWPLHGAILAAFVALALLFMATGRPTAGYPFAELPLHLLLIQNWGFNDQLAWNHPAWSISAEAGAYLAFPLLVALLGRKRWPTWSLLAFAVACAAAVRAIYRAAGYDTLGDDITGLGLVRCLFEFAMGTALCQLYLRLHQRPALVPLAAVTSAALVSCGILLSAAEIAIAPLAIFAGLYALAAGRGAITRTIGGRVLTYLGEISYSTYLGHFLLFILFKLAFVDASLQIGWGGLGGYLALVLAASVALYHGVEKPAQRWLNGRGREFLRRAIRRDGDSASTSLQRPRLP